MAINHVIACCWYGVGYYTSDQGNWMQRSNIDSESFPDARPVWLYCIRFLVHACFMFHSIICVRACRYAISLYCVPGQKIYQSWLILWQILLVRIIIGMFMSIAILTDVIIIIITNMATRGILWDNFVCTYIYKESYVASLHWSMTQFTSATNPIAPNNGWERQVLLPCFWVKDVGNQLVSVECLYIGL